MHGVVLDLLLQSMVSPHCSQGMGVAVQRAAWEEDKGRKIAWEILVVPWFVMI